MNKWLIYNKTLNIKAITDFNYKFEICNYTLVIKNSNFNSYINPQNKEGLFIFGYLIPRLNNHVEQDIPKKIFQGIKSNGVGYINNFKGNFIVIVFFYDRIIILNDQFGVNKYFFSENDGKFIASNDVSIIKKLKSFEISKYNILKYYIFNYFIEGNTIYQGLYYSTGGSYHILDSGITKNKYFYILEYINNRHIEFNKEESIKKASNIWRDIIGQYISFFKNKNISQTLTAGMDSRLILAGFRANNYNPSAFTFGNSNNLDVIHAKKVAKKLNINHRHFSPPDEFYNNYLEQAVNVIKKSSGMASIFRAHRLNAYENFKNDSNVLFFGFIGSEIIRGLYPDRLLVPGICVDYWLKGDITLKDYYPVDWFKFKEEDLSKIKEEILDLGILNRPDLLLFKLMIPLHFAQDIVLNESLEIDSVAPFWDIDFLDFLKHTPFFIDNNRKKDFAKFSHYSRSKGPYFSAQLINILDHKNALISLGKGYSPLDFTISRYYAAIKFAYYKSLFKRRYKTPNFNYEGWFINFLKDYVSTNEFSFIDTEKGNILKYIDNIHGTDELAFLSVVKTINIHLIQSCL